MRVWLYGRLSNDDDVMMNSLENQLEIVREYARKHGHQILGESYDDNVSGMRFDRIPRGAIDRFIGIHYDHSDSGFEAIDHRAILRRSSSLQRTANGARTKCGRYRFC